MYSNLAYEVEDRAQYRQAAVKVTKARRCLKCGAIFVSLWTGDRICKRCKATSDWRAGDSPWCE